MLSLVADGETGCVRPPTPEVLAEAIDRLWEDRASAKRLGEEGYARMQRLGINWATVVEKLTA